jgi:hypothetical protein
MKKFALSLAVLASLTVMAQAAPPTAEQKSEFYEVCVSISQDTALCSCKADAAMELIDSDFMSIVIASMKGTTPASKHYVAYNDYVARSNKICKPNY